MKKQFKTFEEVKACVGQDVAISDWTTVTQSQINMFADATNDHQSGGIRCDFRKCVITNCANLSSPLEVAVFIQFQNPAVL